MTTAKARMRRMRSGGRRVSTVLLVEESGCLGCTIIATFHTREGRQSGERERERERTSRVEGVLQLRVPF